MPSFVMHTKGRYTKQYHSSADGAVVRGTAVPSRSQYDRRATTLYPTRGGYNTFIMIFEYLWSCIHLGYSTTILLGLTRLNSQISF